MRRVVFNFLVIVLSAGVVMTLASMMYASGYLVGDQSVVQPLISLAGVVVMVIVVVLLGIFNDWFYNRRLVNPTVKR